MNNTITLAVVDDFELYREGICAGLSMLGYSVILSAENGKDLLDQMATYQQLPDVCLMDLSMPVMDGFTATVEMKKRWPMVKVIGFSLSNEPATIKKLMDHGADGFIGKGERTAIIDHIIKSLFCG
jgi:DNA-binding NarL/FixJ family response regulator